MSKFCNLFYTYTFKAILFILISVFSWFSGSYILQAFNLYFNDSVSYTNVVLQGNSFEYESSEYVRSEVTTAIDRIISFYFDYMDKNEKDSLSFFGRKKIPTEDLIHVIKDDYRQSVDYLDSLENVTFAIVNHDKKNIFSNIEDLDGKPLGTRIRPFFSNKETLLIVRNAQNPYYIKGTMEEYVDYVSECAASHTDNFDLYISFGDTLLFRFDEAHYEELHFSMKEKIDSTFVPMLIFSVFTLACVLLMTVLAGKNEKGDRVYPSSLDKIPNDLRLILHIIIIISLVAVFDDYIYMLHLGVMSDGNYFLGIAPDFYRSIANICIVFMVYTLLAMLCTVKRQSQLHSLYKNTYICKIVTALKKTQENSAEM